MIKCNQWYKLNEKEFTDILRFVSQDIANNQKYIKSLNRVVDAFTNNKVLYLKLSRESIRQPLSWHYRTSYSEFFNGQCLEYKDIMFDKASNNSLDDIILRSGDLICWKDGIMAHTSTVCSSDGKRIKDSMFANDNIIKIVRNGIVIYDQQAVDRAHKLAKPPANYELKVIDDMLAGDDKLTAEQIRKRAEKLILNSIYRAGNRPVYVPRRFPAMCDNFDAKWDTNKENKEEKVMEENKIQAIRNIIDKYGDDAARELNRQYEEQEREVKAKDPNAIALREYIAVLNKNRKEDTEPYNVNTFNEIYTAETEIQLDKLYNTLMGKKRALREQCDEVRNLCMLCDTYEQMRQVLADYDIIPNSKKRGK